MRQFNSVVLISKDNLLTRVIESKLASHAQSLFVCEKVSEALTLVNSIDPDCLYIGNSLELDADKKQLSMILMDAIKANKFVFGCNKAFEKSLPDIYFNALSPIEEIIASLDKILELKTKEPFIPMSAKFIAKYKIIIYDLYLKVASRKIKIHTSHGNMEQINHYLQKGCQFFYLTNTDFLALTKNYKNTYKSEYSSSDPKEIHEEVINYSKELLENLDFEIGDISLIDITTSHLIEHYSNDKILQSIFENFHSEKYNFQLKHNTLIIILSYCLMQQLNEYKESRLKKIIFASFIHDIHISQHPNLALITSKEDFENLEFKEKYFVNCHAAEAAIKAQKIRDLDPEILKIITEQHGSETGYGINDKPTDFFLSIVFKICSDLSIKILENQKLPIRKSFLDILDCEQVIKGKEYYHYYHALKCRLMNSSKLIANL